jgi:hypothetical protein
MSTDATDAVPRDAGSGDARERAHALVTGLGAGPWRLDRGAVVDRLHELVANPGLIRQGQLNLCGPAALMHVWLGRDPVAAVTYAAELFEHGHARVGELAVRPSAALIRTPFGRTERERSCAGADWMMMAALRDSTNRLLPYTRTSGLSEAAAAITTPRILRRWLRATGLYGDVRDETNLVLRQPMAHATGLTPTRERDVFLLVAQEMFRTPATRLRRLRDRTVSLLPNHWVLQRSALETDGRTVALRFWSWGADYQGALERPVFARCYYGALVADVASPNDSSHERK